MNFNDLSDKYAKERSEQMFASVDVRSMPAGKRPMERGRKAVWQARLVLLVMINIAQLWILSATIEASLAGHFEQLVPLIAASVFCWVIALTIFLWWKPVSRRQSSSGYVRE